MSHLVEFLAWAFVACPFVIGFLFGCNCCSTCALFSDDFSTDRTGTDYTGTGSYSVGSGVITFTSSSARLISNTTTAGGATASFATAKITMASTSDVGRLILGYVDANNYWFAEVQPGATNGTVKIFQRSGGTNTQRGGTITVPSLAAGVTANVCLSITSGGVTASVNSTVGLTYGTSGFSTTIAGTSAGMATGNVSSSVTFDDYTHNKHRNDDATCSSCSGCPTICATEAKSVSITWSGFTAGTKPACATCYNDYNATFVVPWGGTTSACAGFYFHATSFCGGPGGFNWVFSKNSGTGQLQFSTSIGFDAPISAGVIMRTADITATPANCSTVGPVSSAADLGSDSLCLNATAASFVMVAS